MSQTAKRQAGRLQARVDSKSNWETKNPQLLDREIGYERETGRYKIGDGIHTWNELSYATTGVDDNIIHADENGNIGFGSIETLKFYSDNGLGSGAHNTIGGKAFKIVAEPTGIVGETGIYQLDSVEGIEIGMAYSAITSIAAYHQGIIQHVNTVTKSVEVNNFAGYGLNRDANGNAKEDEPENYNYYNTFLLDDYPELGTISIGANAAAFGQNVNAHNVATHAEGKDTKALGKFSHTEGLETIAGHASHAEGAHTKALGAATHAEGDSTTSDGHYSHAEGYKTKSSGKASHAEGVSTEAIGDYSHSEGENTKATEIDTHAEGCGTEASGKYSHAEGYQSKSSGFVSHAEGCRTEASGEYSHSQGNDTIALGKKAHAEGQNTLASGENAHAEGLGSNTRNGSVVTAGTTGALGKNSHSEGTTTTASGEGSHAEGQSTTASGLDAHAEGVNSVAQGAFSHAEGNATQALGALSHTEGENSIARENATYAHVEGKETIAGSPFQHVQGKFNIEDINNKYAHIVGNGTSNIDRSNAHTLDWNGNAWFAGNVKVGGTKENNYSDAKTLISTSDVSRFTGNYTQPVDVDLTNYQHMKFDDAGSQNVVISSKEILLPLGGYVKFFINGYINFNIIKHPDDYSDYSNYKIITDNETIMINSNSTNYPYHFEGFVSYIEFHNLTTSSYIKFSDFTISQPIFTNGLIRGEDQVKLDTIEDGATKTIVDFVPDETSPNPIANGAVCQIINNIGSYILNIDYETLLAFDTSEIVFNAGTSTTSVLGQAILGQMVLA